MKIARRKRGIGTPKEASKSAVTDTPRTSHRASSKQLEPSCEALEAPAVFACDSRMESLSNSARLCEIERLLLPTSS